MQPLLIGRNRSTLGLLASSSSSSSSSCTCLSSRSHSTTAAASSAIKQADEQGRAPTRPYVELGWVGRGIMLFGSAAMGIVDTRRHDMIATLSEVSSSGPFLERLRTQMRSTPSGRRLLRERPRITSTSVDLDKLSKLEEGTFGGQYWRWLKRCGVTPDTREPVQFIKDPELAYIMQRYRESHDMYHVLLGFPVTLSAELVVKWFELAHFGLPVAFLSSVVGPLRLKKEARRRLERTYGTWALEAGGKARGLIGVEWEKVWEMDIQKLREELGVIKPPMEWEEYREEGRRLKREREAASSSERVDL